MNKEELIILFEEFLNENGMWYTFSDFLQEKYDKKPTDIGFSDDE